MFRLLPCKRGERCVINPSQGDRQFVCKYWSHTRAPSALCAWIKRSTHYCAPKKWLGSMISGKAEIRGFAPSDVRGQSKSLAAPKGSGRGYASGARFLTATAPLVIGNKEYVVVVGAPKQPIKAVLHGALVVLLIGLVVWLGFATWGSCFLIKRALVPVRKIALAALALPAAHPDKCGSRPAMSAMKSHVYALP